MKRCWSSITRDARWFCDLGRVHAKRYTDNVVDLMVAKLNRLPPETLAALRQLACVGASAEFALLGTVCQTSQEELHESLWEAVRSGLVLRSENSYAFQHDRIQEAAYSLIPEEARAEAHLRIGRMLVAHTPTGKLEEAIFEIVSQLNRASSLVTAPEEREQLAEFNLLAGKRAQASSAYVSALNYLTAGAALLTEDSWQRRRELSFALELARANCEFASGAIAEAEKRLRSLSMRAVTTGERVAVACLQVDLYQGIDRSDEAIAVGLRALRHLGVDFPERPTEADARRAYDGIWTRLGTRAIEDLIDLPLMSDPDSVAAVDLLIRIAVPGYFNSFHLSQWPFARLSAWDSSEVTVMHLVSPTRSWARWQDPTSASSMPATASDGWGASWPSDRGCSAFKPGHTAHSVSSCLGLSMSEKGVSSCFGASNSPAGSVKSVTRDMLAPSSPPTISWPATR